MYKLKDNEDKVLDQGIPKDIDERLDWFIETTIKTFDKATFALRDLDDKRAEEGKKISEILEDEMFEYLAIDENGMTLRVQLGDDYESINAGGIGGVAVITAKINFLRLFESLGYTEEDRKVLKAEGVFGGLDDSSLIGKKLINKLGKYFNSKIITMVNMYMIEQIRSKDVALTNDSK